MKKISLAIVISVCSLYVLTSCEPDDNFDETEVVVVNDCEDLMANFGDVCVYTDSTGNTVTGVINTDCICFPDGDSTYFDCPNLNANIGDSCVFSPIGIAGVVDADCECVQDGSGSIFDCPDLQANIGDSCNDGNPATFGDTVNSNCICEGSTNSFDCPDLGVNFGDSCFVAGTTIAGVIDTNCECEPSSTGTEYDCPDLMADFGAICTYTDTLGNVFTGFIDTDCLCTAQGFDCPDLMLNVGDSCALNPAGTIWGTVSGNCICD